MLVKEHRTRQCNFSGAVLSKSLSSFRKSQEIAFSSLFDANAHTCSPCGQASGLPPLLPVRDAPFLSPPIFLWYLPCPCPLRWPNLLMPFPGLWGVSAQRLVTEAHVPGRVTSPAISQSSQPCIPLWGLGAFLERTCLAAPRGSPRHGHGCDLWKRVQDLYK